MLTIAHPWLFLLLPLPWLVRRLLPTHHERKAAVRVPFLQRLSRLAGLQPGSGVAVARRPLSQWLMLSLAWSLVVVAITRPQWLEEPIIKELPMRDLLVAVDLSGSMEAQDFTDKEGKTVDRLTAVKEVLDNFFARRDGDRVGLILFGSAAFIQVPFTDDLEVVRELLKEAQIRMLGPRTMLGDAMGLAINLFERSEVDERVLMSSPMATIPAVSYHQNGRRKSPAITVWSSTQSLSGTLLLWVSRHWMRRPLKISRASPVVVISTPMTGRSWKTFTPAWMNSTPDR